MEKRKLKLKNKKDKQQTGMQKSLTYLEHSKTYIYAIIILFLISVFVGFVNADSLSRIIAPILQELIEETSDLKGISLIIFIFFNNALTSLIALILGIFLAILPIFATISNGMILGYVLERIVQVSPLEIWRLFPHGIFELPAIFIALGLGVKLGITITKNYLVKNKKLLSMKILGILAIILGLVGIGAINLSIKTRYPEIFVPLGLILLLPYIILFFIIDKKLRKLSFQEIYLSIKVFFNIVLPLLILAAIIEGILITIT